MAGAGVRPGVQAQPGAPGRFVVFEGIDGSGKSTALAAVAQRLWQEGVQVATTREETATATGAWVRDSIRDGLDPLATTFLFLADRARHVPELEAWRRDGRHVLCDRFLHSTLAYQGVTLRGRFPDAPGFLRSLHAGWCPLPDRVVLFRADPAACVERTRRRATEASRYEKAQFLAEVQELYLRLAAEDPKHFVVLDAERPMAALIDAAEAEVRRALGLA